MSDLLWFSGITWDTPMREIGWTYVLVGAMLVFIIHLVRKI